MASKIQIRRDTAANWTSNNPTLSLGEIGIESDTFCFKFGNGSTAWTSLTYGAINPTLYTALTSVADGDEIPIYDISSSTVSYVTAKNLYSSLYSGRTTLTTLATDDTISVKDTSASDLGVITEANLANTLLANRTVSTSADSTDLVPFYDVSASTGKTITTANLANNLHTNATEMTTLASNDTVCVYDTSATSVGQITVSNLATSIVSQGSALTATSDSDRIPVYDDSGSTIAYITSANRQTDIASRSLPLAACRASTGTGTGIADAYALKNLFGTDNVGTGWATALGKNKYYQATSTTGTFATYIYNACVALYGDAVKRSVLLTLKDSGSNTAFLTAVCFHYQDYQDVVTVLSSSTLAYSSSNTAGSIVFTGYSGTLTLTAVPIGA